MTEYEIGDVVGVTFLTGFHVVVAKPVINYHDGWSRTKYTVREFDSTIEREASIQFIRSGAEQADREISYLKDTIEEAKQKLVELKAFKSKHCKKKTK